MTDKRPKIEFLEAVRGIAAAIVVVQHVLAGNFPALHDLSQQSIDLGRVGVVAFFLVSGYVIPLSLERQNIRTFVTRRFFRLYPVFWLALGLFCIIHVATGVVSAQSPLAILANVFMVQGLLGIVPILPPAWTLTIELVFYGQSVAARTFNRLRLVALSGWFWLAVYLLLCATSRVMGRDLPVTFALLLFVAAVGHSIHLRDQGAPSPWKQYLCAAAVAIPVGSVLSIDAYWWLVNYSVSAFLGFGLFLWMYSRRDKPFPKWMLWLGSISYAVYLFHPLVNDTLHYLLGLPVWLLIPLNFVLVPVVGWLVHRWVELPTISLGRALTQTSGKRSAQMREITRL